MELKAGDIIYVYFIVKSNYKYAICICPVNLYFFLINSEPRRTAPDAQIKIKKEDFPFLKKDYSYINTASIFTIYQDRIDKATIEGSLPPHIKAEIIRVVNKGRHLSQNQKNIIETNLGL